MSAYESLATDRQFGNADSSESPAVSEKAAPFIKWAGGKRSIIDELTGRLPPDITNYYEPFLGGGALFFAIHQRIERAFLSDTNLDLVITYNVVRRDPEPLLLRLEQHAAAHNQEHYYNVRSQQDLREPVDIAARFIYLNKTCFNGLWRVNRSGHFNVPMGRYSNPGIVQRQNLLACSAALQKATIQYHEFDSIKPKRGDFAYFDPPYHPTVDTSFTGYTKLDFTEIDQVRLREFSSTLSKKGVKVMLSNSDTPFIRGIYSGKEYSVETVQAPRLVNCKPGKRNAVNELIITSY